MNLAHPLTRLLALVLLCILSGCVNTDDPVPQEKISQLEGIWLQDEGQASIHFYSDHTIKLTMPKEQPPIRLLSEMEIIKDEQIGFGVGDRWNGPVHVEIAKDHQSLQLIFPGDVVRTLNFHPQP